jgi:hypothetical protein
MSMVSIPRRVAVIGPIVDPHGMLFFEENTWVGSPACSQMAAYR